MFFIFGTMKAFAISDIHGCARTLETLVNNLSLQSGDALFFLGDYINKGPNSAQVIDLLRQYEKAPFQTVFLQGNHDHLIVLAAQGKIDREIAMNAGLGITLQSFGVGHPSEISTGILDWLAHLPTYHQWEAYWMVHAGFKFMHTDPLQDIQSHRLIRHWQKTLDRRWLGNRYIIHGHTQQTHDQIKKHIARMEDQRIVNIDAGCVSIQEPGKGNMCAFDLIHRKPIFQPNLDLVSPHY